MSTAILESIKQLKAENTRLLAEVERLEAEAAALRAALELFRAAEDHRIKHRCISARSCDTWFGLQNAACLAAMDTLTTDAGRPMLERLRRAENAIQEMLGTYMPGERAKLLALWNDSLRSHIPNVEPEHGHLSSLYAFISMATQAMLELAEAGNVAREER